MNGSGTGKVNNIELFGLCFCSVRLEEAVELIVRAAQHKNKVTAVTPNVDHIVTIMKNPELFEIWQKSEFIFADGMPLVWLTRLMKNGSLPERVTGADLMPLVCREAAKSGLKIMIVGGGEGVARKARINLENSYPDIRIVGTFCPDIGFETDPGKTEQLVKKINNSRPDVLFFCVGAPKSEKWLHENMNSLDFGIALCVGAAVDFVAGSVKRAPQKIRNFGLEWLWRLCQEPGRLWKRYLVKDTQFIYYALQELMKSYFPRLNKEL